MVVRTAQHGVVEYVRPVLAIVVTVYGMASGLAALLQARQLLERRRSCDVSALLFGVYLGGYVVWLTYGLSIGSAPIAMVNAVGLVSVASVLVIALSLRGSIWDPHSWRSCPI